MSEENVPSLEYLQAVGHRLGVASVAITLTQDLCELPEHSAVESKVQAVQVIMLQSGTDQCAEVAAWKKSYGKAVMKIFNDE